MVNIYRSKLFLALVFAMSVVFPMYLVGPAVIIFGAYSIVFREIFRDLATPRDTETIKHLNRVSLLYMRIVLLASIGFTVKVISLEKMFAEERVITAVMAFMFMVSAVNFVTWRRQLRPYVFHMRTMKRVNDYSDRVQNHY